MRGQEEQQTRAKVFYRIPTLPGPAEHPPPRSSPGAGAVSGLPYEFIVTPPRADGARRVNPQPAFAGALARKQTAPVSYRELSEGHCGGTAASACCEGSVPAAG